MWRIQRRTKLKRKLIISQSAAECYNECAYKFYLRYILGVKLIEDITYPAAQTGKEVGRMTEGFRYTKEDAELGLEKKQVFQNWYKSFKNKSKVIHKHLITAFPEILKWKKKESWGAMLLRTTSDFEVFLYGRFVGGIF